MSEPFIPAWAKEALEKPSAFDLAEFQVLQQFYEAWEALHKIPKDRFHKKQQEKAALTLVEKAVVLRRMKSDKEIVLVPRFMN